MLLSLALFILNWFRLSGVVWVSNFLGAAFCHLIAFLQSLLNQGLLYLVELELLGTHFSAIDTRISLRCSMELSSSMLFLGLSCYIDF